MFGKLHWIGPVALLAWLPGSLISQSAGFTGPVSGFVFNRSSRTIQPLNGIPGAAYTGPSVLNQVDWASVAPDGAWAFVAASGQGAFVGGLSGSSAAPLSVNGLLASVDRVVWNRSGSAAVVYSSSANQLQRVQFSAGAASADSPVDLSPWGQPSALAIDPAGQTMAFAIAGSGIYLLHAGQSPLAISSISQPGALAFDDTGLRLFAADLATQQVVVFDSHGTPSPFVSLVQSEGSVVKPVGLAVSGGGRYLLLADRASQSVLVYDLVSATLANTIPLSSAPSRLEALSSAPSFLLNGGNRGESLLILDARQLPYVYFVPATQEARQ